MFDAHLCVDPCPAGQTVLAAPCRSHSRTFQLFTFQRSLSRPQTGREELFCQNAVRQSSPFLFSFSTPAETHGHIAGLSTGRVVTLHLPRLMARAFYRPRASHCRLPPPSHSQRPPAGSGVLYFRVSKPSTGSENYSPRTPNCQLGGPNQY